MSRIAVFPGSFDPITNAHLDVLGRATRLFDRIVVGVLTNPGKRPAFSVDERIAMIRASVADLGEGIEVEAFDGLTVEFARRHGAGFVVRGLRAVSDFEFELQLAHTNRRLAPEIGRCIAYLAFVSPSFCDHVRLLDSTPVPCGQSRETTRRSEFAGSAGYGYCRSHSRWF